MTNWIEVIAESALRNGEHALVSVDGVDVAVFKIDGECFAIEDACTHDNTELASGELEGDEIICPRHGARFCVKTGEVKCAPAYENIPTYPVRIVDGKIQVGTVRD